MKYSPALLLAAGAALANAQSDSVGGPDPVETYLLNVCAPRNATGGPDYDFPCNEVSAFAKAGAKAQSSPY